jgi:hypothetical protein
MEKRTKNLIILLAILVVAYIGINFMIVTSAFNNARGMWLDVPFFTEKYEDDFFDRRMNEEYGAGFLERR